MFPTTRWTLILAAREGDEARRAALESLLATYWKPVYFYLRRRGLAVEAAEDAVQGFCVQLLERDFLPRLDPSRGRFRSYLLTSLDHYLANQHERETAQKRGGGVRLVPIDLALAERELAAAPAEAATAYEREWALGIMERALRRLRADYETGRRQGRADVFLRFFSFEPAPSYAEAASPGRAHGVAVQGRPAPGPRPLPRAAARGGGRHPAGRGRGRRARSAISCARSRRERRLPALRPAASTPARLETCPRCLLEGEVPPALLGDSLELIEEVGRGGMGTSGRRATCGWTGWWP